MNTFNLTLDLDKEQGLPQLVTLRQGDKSGTQLVATIYDHGQLVGGGYTARVSLRHPGSGKTYYRETAIFSNGVATVTVDEQRAATVAGVTTGYFELLQGSTVKASTADFIVRILPSAEDGAVPGEVYDSAIEDALAELDAATGRISQMVVDATAEYLAAHPEITTTVQDNSVTDAKLIQSGGVLDRVGRLWWRLENLLTNTPAEAESVTVSDAAKTPVAGLTVFGKSTQDGTPTPDAPVAIESVVAPNLLPITATTTTINGVTFTRNADGTYTVAGTATATIEFNLIPNGTEVVTLPAGKYSLSGCPDGGSVSTWKMDVRLGTPGTPSTGNYVTDYGSGSTVTRQAEFAINRARIVVYSGVTIDATFGPMFTASDTPMPYVPYDHVGLWARGRNLLPPSVFLSYGTAYADGGNGAITVMASDSRTWPTMPTFAMGDGTYTLSRSDASGSLTVQMYDADGNQVDSRTVANGTARSTFTAPAGTAFARVKVGVDSSSHTTNYPFTTTVQLEHGTAATAYEPYKESVTSVPLDGHTLRSLPDGTRDEVAVDQYGHVTLTQRVGSATFDGSETWTMSSSYTNVFSTTSVSSTVVHGLPNSGVNPLRCDHGSAQSVTSIQGGSDGVAIAYSGAIYARLGTFGSASALTTWLASNPVTIQYPLATPATIDLGTIDPTALVGPDMTAQAVPSAPMQLTYERDLNVTLARLESAIAELATN